MVETFKVTDRGPSIVERTTPNEGWDKYGVVYLELEECDSPATVYSILHLLEEADVFVNEAFVREALAWCIAQGMVERVT